jgi:hypothetical protein
MKRFCIVLSVTICTVCMTAATAAMAKGNISAVTTGPVYWSTSEPDCSGVQGPVTITDSSGAILGYSCKVSGTFVWLAAGGPWSSSIRVAAPDGNAIDADYRFYDPNGNSLSMDTTLGSGSPVTSGNEAEVALYANQPLEVDLLGATSGAPSYSATQTGSVYAEFYCPDATTCSDVLPQLLYSALPTIPWSLSVPISWANELALQWSAEGIDDGGAHRVSLAIYNQSATTTQFMVRVYDSTGNLFGTGWTPLLLPYQASGEAQTYGVLLSQLVSPLPSGIFKVVIDGGADLSSVEVLQFTGSSATTLQVSPDSAPTSILAAARQARLKNGHVRSEHVAGALHK